MSIQRVVVLFLLVLSGLALLMVEVVGSSPSGDVGDPYDAFPSGPIGQRFEVPTAAAVVFPGNPQVISDIL